MQNLINFCQSGHFAAIRSTVSFRPFYPVRIHYLLRFIRSSSCRCFSKQLFLKISQYSQKNTCVGVSFLIHLHACNFIKRNSDTGGFFCEYCENRFNNVIAVPAGFSKYQKKKKNDKNINMCRLFHFSYLTNQNRYSEHNNCFKKETTQRKASGASFLSNISAMVIQFKMDKLISLRHFPRAHLRPSETGKVELLQT